MARIVGPHRSTVVRRRRRVAAASAVTIGLLVVVTGRTGSTPSMVAIRVDGRVLAKLSRDDAQAKDRLPRSLTVRRDGYRITYRVDRQATLRTVKTSDSASVDAVVRPVSSTVPASVVAQALPNNCETAALQVLLQTLGTSADQRRLQAAIDRDGPLDPAGSSPDQIWGDPELGYVGRADGTGPAGGFGVYQGPILRLAQSRGVSLDDLTGASTQAIVDRVLTGRAVMVWIGLEDGPYGSWRSPEGRPVRVNYNEHTVVVTGVRGDGRLEVVNVLEGTREVWSRAFFEQRFARLGRRAIAAPADA